MVSGPMTLSPTGAPTSAQIIAADKKVRKLFTYVHDRAGNDEWNSFAANVKLNKPIYGDCDDFASTVLDLLAQGGAPRTSMARGLVSSKKTATVDHMVGYCMDDKGKVWVVGDTFGPAYGIKQMAHFQIKYSPVSTGIAWLTGKIPGT